MACRASLNTPRSLTNVPRKVSTSVCNSSGGVGLHIIFLNKILPKTPAYPESIECEASLKNNILLGFFTGLRIAVLLSKCQAYQCCE